MFDRAWTADWTKKPNGHLTDIKFDWIHAQELLNAKIPKSPSTGYPIHTVSDNMITLNTLFDFFFLFQAHFSICG